jgi:hypothetical protein
MQVLYSKVGYVQTFVDKISMSKGIFVMFVSWDPYCTSDQHVPLSCTRKRRLN